MKEVVHTSPTIGSNVEEIVVKNTHFLMWDIGGQESLRSSWNTYYSNTEVRGLLDTFQCSGIRGEQGIVQQRAYWQLVCLFSAQTAAGGAHVRGQPFKGASLKGRARVSLHSVSEEKSTE